MINIILYNKVKKKNDRQTKLETEGTPMQVGNGHRERERDSARA